MMKSVAIIIILVLVSACESKDERELEIGRNAGKIDFSELVPGQWNKVCLFAPYSNNKVAEETLGFKWDLEGKSRIYNLDGITLFVFAKGKKVEYFYEVPRWADFSHLGGSCFERNNANFNVKPNGAEHVPNNL